MVEDDTYLLNVLRYIHQNPLKARMVMDISRYRWSSYCEYMGTCRIIDRDFILGIFHHDRETALSLFKGFHKNKTDDTLLDIHENKRLTDREAIEAIKRICHITHCINLKKRTKKDGRDQYLKSLKEHGLSSRQIARLTGISRGVIVKA